MKIHFDSVKLDISRNNYIKIIQCRNFEPNIKYHFPSGAMELVTYESDKKHFSDLFVFYMHIVALQYLDYTKYNLPSDFCSSTQVLEELNKEEFQYLSQGYLDSFSGLAEDTLWLNKLKLDYYNKGYKVEILGTGLFLIGSTGSSFFAFLYQSID